ncbi:hypothetical protein B0H17DRAFT_942244 [Mycena rosella]|uniref:Uncharacterized protein n=1 Tax=Mycena rosella TaxID=1033263 RepID=A0AAD7GEX0_MYCRO|nr:hypothetical protein B0H17DRAFT_942244 [Mycena rosella]
MTQKTIQRVQFLVTGVYAFTDYRSQGQTLPYIYVDIGTPPTGGLSLFNLYIVLSRSLGRDMIRLLRDFDDEMFKRGMSQNAEDDRLEGLDEDTSQGQGCVEENWNSKARSRN